MQRGILQLTKEEVVELNNAFHWDINGSSILASKLQYAIENSKGINEIEVSEDDLELLLDDIMPVDKDNTTLKSAMEKIGELLRKFRYLNVPSRVETRN